MREKYPLLFLTARAPGHSELPKKILLDLVEANRQQLLAVGVAEQEHRKLAALHQLSPRIVIFVSRGKRKNGTTDGSGGNPALARAWVLSFCGPRPRFAL